METTALKALREKPALSVDPKARKAQTEIKGSKVRRVFKAFKVLKVFRGTKGSPALREIKVFKVLKVFRETKEIRDFKAPTQAFKVPKEIKDCKVFRVFRGPHPTARCLPSERPLTAELP